jgi:archaellum component FlaC
VKEMDELFKQLEQIRQFLEQIQNITENQMTILLSDSIEGLDMIEQMAEYKGELTTQLEKVEKEFQALYNEKKEFIHSNDQINNSELKQLKDNVKYILQLKDQVILQEQKNYLLLKEAVDTRNKVKIPKSVDKAVSEYNKHKKKT